VAIREDNSCLLSGGAPDSPVHHRTGTVHGPVQIAFLKWHSRPLQNCSCWRTGHCRCTPDSPMPPADRWSRPRVARGFGGRPLHSRPLAHRTVRCSTGQSGAALDSPVNYSRTPPTNSREWPVRQKPAWRTGHCPVHHRTLSGAPPDSPVCQTALSLRCSSQVFSFFSFL
jgi:hypothetical protein